MKIIAILTLVAVFLTGSSIGAVIGFGEVILDAGGTMLESVNDILGIPDAQRYDILSIPPYERITHPVLNPDDTMSVADFLYMRHKDAVRDNMYITDSIDKTMLYGNNVYQVVDRYLYYIKGTAVGTLATDLQDYKQGQKVLFTYRIPCCRILYKGEIYFMLDPLTTSWLPGFTIPSPFAVTGYDGANLISGVNIVKEDDYLSVDAVIGSPDSGSFNDGIIFNSEDYRVVVEQTQYELVDYLNDEVVIDRMNVNILTIYTEGLKDGAFNDIDWRNN